MNFCSPMKNLRALVKSFSQKRQEQRLLVNNLRAERDAKKHLSSGAQIQRARLNDLDGFPHAAIVESERPQRTRESQARKD